jgi:hypothetical protein
VQTVVIVAGGRGALRAAIADLARGVGGRHLNENSTMAPRPVRLAPAAD